MIKLAAGIGFRQLNAALVVLNCIRDFLVVQEDVWVKGQQDAGLADNEWSFEAK